MRKKIIIVIVTALFTTHNLYSQNTPNDLIKLNHLAKTLVDLNKKNSDKNTEILDFLLKYMNSNENPTQFELNKLVINLGVNDTISFKITSKEEAFILIDFYSTNIERKLTNNLNVNDTSEKVKSIFSNTSYTNFRDQIKAVNPKVTDIEIQKLYLEMQEKLKNI